MTISAAIATVFVLTLSALGQGVVHEMADPDQAACLSAAPGESTDVGVYLLNEQTLAGLTATLAGVVMAEYPIPAGCDFVAMSDLEVSPDVEADHRHSFDTMSVPPSGCRTAACFVHAGTACLIPVISLVIPAISLVIPAKAGIQSRATAYLDSRLHVNDSGHGSPRPFPDLRESIASPGPSCCRSSDRAADEERLSRKLRSCSRMLLPSSFPRKRESSLAQQIIWIPAFAGMTASARLCSKRALMTEPRDVCRPQSMPISFIEHNTGTRGLGRAATALVPVEIAIVYPNSFELIESYIEPCPEKYSLQYVRSGICQD